MAGALIGEVFMTNPTDGSAGHLQSILDQPKRRGMRYPLAVLLAIAVLAKLCGQSQVHALAQWGRVSTGRWHFCAPFLGKVASEFPSSSRWCDSNP
jgi:hypothetical protein